MSNLSQTSCISPASFALQHVYYARPFEKSSLGSRRAGGECLRAPGHVWHDMMLLLFPPFDRWLRFFRAAWWRRTNGGVCSFFFFYQWPSLAFLLCYAGDDVDGVTARNPRDGNKYLCCCHRCVDCDCISSHWFFLNCWQNWSSDGSQGMNEMLDKLAQENLKISQLEAMLQVKLQALRFRFHSSQKTSHYLCRSHCLQYFLFFLIKRNSIIKAAHTLTICWIHFHTASVFQRFLTDFNWFHWFLCVCPLVPERRIRFGISSSSREGGWERHRRFGKGQRTHEGGLVIPSWTEGRAGDAEGQSDGAQSTHR